MATFEFRLRAPRTLQLLALMRDFIEVRWTRRAFDAGDFQVVLDAGSIDKDVIPRGTILEVLRDGQAEFAGAIEQRSLDDPAFKGNRRANVWTLAGRDLLGWWGSMRVVGAATADGRGPAPAETVVKDYWTAHLLDPTDNTRNANLAELLSVTFTVPASAGLGSTVEDEGRRKNLLTGITIPLSKAGAVAFDVSLVQDATTPTGYQLDASAVVDRTVAVGALPFAVSWETVRSLVYRENVTSLANYLYVLGSGTGDGRTVRECSDAASIAADFRREAILDQRNAATNDQLDQNGDAEIARAITAATTALAQPRTDSSSPSKYRTDWDVGQLVTIAVPQVGIEIDRLIAEASVTLAAGKTEEVSMTLGDRPATDKRLIAEGLRRTLPAQVE